MKIFVKAECSKEIIFNKKNIFWIIKTYKDDITCYVTDILDNDWSLDYEEICNRIEENCKDNIKISYIIDIKILTNKE